MGARSGIIELELGAPTLKIMPIRVTVIQYARLHLARTRDGLTIQEHVRRALDVYLDQIGVHVDPRVVPEDMPKLEHGSNATKPTSKPKVKPPEVADLPMMAIPPKRRRPVVVQR